MHLRVKCSMSSCFLSPSGQIIEILNHIPQYKTELVSHVNSIVEILPALTLCLCVLFSSHQVSALKGISVWAESQREFCSRIVQALTSEYTCSNTILYIVFIFLELWAVHLWCKHEIQTGTRVKSLALSCQIIGEQNENYEMKKKKKKKLSILTIKFIKMCLTEWLQPRWLTDSVFSRPLITSDYLNAPELRQTTNKLTNSTSDCLWVTPRSFVCPPQCQFPFLLLQSCSYVCKKNHV